MDEEEDEATELRRREPHKLAAAADDCMLPFSCMFGPTGKPQSPDVREGRADRDRDAGSMYGGRRSPSAGLQNADANARRCC